MNFDTPISQLMTSEVVYAEPDNKFTQIRDLFLNNNMHHLPIVKEGNLEGIISVNDIMRCYAVDAAGLSNIEDENLDQNFNIEAIMTKSPVHIAPQAGVKHAIRIFNEHNFQALPVVDLGKLVGIITLKDIVSHLAGE